MKIRFNSENNLSFKKELVMHCVAMIIRSLFYNNNRHYPKLFSYDCFYEWAK